MKTILLGTITLILALAPASRLAAASGPLHQAVRAGDLSAIRALLTNGTDVNSRDDGGNTPLILAAFCADVNAEGGQPVDGFLGTTHTPLQLALKRGDTPIAQALLKSGARPSAVRFRRHV